MCSQGMSKLTQLVHRPLARALSHLTLRLRQLSQACGSLLFFDPDRGGLPPSSDEDIIAYLGEISESQVQVERGCGRDSQI